MAKNVVMEPGWKVPLACSHPTTPLSGDPVRFGNITGVALTDKGAGGNIATETTVYFGPGIVTVPVKGVDAGGNSPVAIGDEITYTDADTPPLSKKVASATARIFGYAMEIVTTGGTATIRVLRK